MLLERLVQEGSDLSRVANWGYSAYVLAGVLQDELGGAYRVCLFSNPPRPDAEKAMSASRRLPVHIAQLGTSAAAWVIYVACVRGWAHAVRVP